MAVMRLKDGRWIVYYRDRRPDGKTFLKREYFGRSPESETAARARDRSLGLNARRPPRPQPGPTFAEIARAYFHAHTFASDPARDQHRIRMVSRLLPWFGPLAAVAITDADLDSYIAMRRQTVTDGTIRREMVDLKAILNFAARRQPPMIPFNPVRDYRIPREIPTTIMPPTDAELSAILSCSIAHVLRIVLLCYYLGLRPGPVECYRLRWDMVDFGAGTILISSAKKGGNIKRSIPLHAEFIPILQQWRRIDEPLGIPWIVSYAGKPVKKIATAWANTLRMAKITRRLRLYDLRHLFVTRALENGADIKPLAEVVGSRPETLMRFYQHVSAAAHRRTVSLIPAAPGNTSVLPPPPKKRRNIFTLPGKPKP